MHGITDLKHTVVMHTVRLQITGVGESARTENHTTTV